MIDIKTGKRRRASFVLLNWTARIHTPYDEDCQVEEAVADTPRQRLQSLPRNNLSVHACT
jgi:hypothetical protein